MGENIIFNNYSLPFEDITKCRSSVLDFFSLLHSALDIGLDSIRVCDTVGTNWFNYNYCEGFVLSQWMTEIKSDDSKYIKRIMDKTKSPLIDSASLMEMYGLSNFNISHLDQPTFSLGAAYLLGFPVISFVSADIWEADSLSLNHEYLNPDSGEITNTEVRVVNISSLVHLTVFAGILKKERQASQDYLKTLKENNVEFPMLVFCSKALQGFMDVQVGEKLLGQILEVLKKLNEVIKTATSDYELINMSGLEISGESESTKRSSKLMSYRKIKMPNGDYQYFDLHVKNFIDSKRLHFFPCFVTKKIFIGYFGKHLPI